jgi:D-arginine dehydrogenase
MDRMRHDYDVAIIGAGIVGASIAYQLAPHVSVCLLDAEAQAGYHSTGRSAALYMESYGPPAVRQLTRASFSFFQQSPEGFTQQALISPRAAMMIASPDQTHALDAHEAMVRSTGAPIQRLNTEAARAIVPVLRPGAVASASIESRAFDIDVHALHQGFLSGAARHAAAIHLRHRLTRVSRSLGSVQAKPWELGFEQAGLPSIRASMIVNAAGAWGDEVASLAGIAPMGLIPKRRSAFTFAQPALSGVADWPMVIGVEEDFYFKPDAGQMLGSPANADPVHAHDVVAEELDIATAIDRIQNVTDMIIRRPIRTWAGLRSFVEDGSFVGGFDGQDPGFFWAIGQGGYGIQSAPAVGALYASMILGRAVPSLIQDEGLQLADLSPQRFGKP